MARHIQDDVKAGRIWSSLMDAPDQVLSFGELVEETGMTPCQVERGLRYTNHILQVEEMQPIIYSAEMGGYWLPEEYDENFIKARLVELKHVFTRTHTANARNQATVGKFGVDHIDKRIQKDFDRLQEDISDVIEALEVQLAEL